MRKRQSRKGKVFALIALGMVLGAAGLYAMKWSLHATSTTEFCVSCHSMSKPHEEWQASSHFFNKSGVRAGCADCHIPHDNDWNYLKTKITDGLGDLIAEMRGTIPDDEAFEAKRGDMAKHVWAQMKANDSVTCRGCHTGEAMDIYSQSEKAQEKHAQMAENGETCIDCHRGLVHFPPEFADEANQAAEHLLELAKQTPADAKVLYPIGRIAVYADKDKSAEIANILPTAKMEVTASEGDMRAITLHGFQQEGATQVIYAQSGKRIITGIVEESAFDRIEGGDYAVDADTDSQWRPVTFSGWVAADGLLADAEALWHYGDELNNAYCGGCHAVIPAGHYLANQWPPIVNGMVSRTSMDDSAKLMLTYYLQHHAKDMTGGHP
ncbi:MAG: NapC/NirT family cytochrome c [Cardiobacteriaceae bacterium]|nr:NapC/NirT family cytochrome c [Cardiobacteriaceae bacterium]